MQDILRRHLPVDLGDIRIVDPETLSLGVPADHPLMRQITPSGVTQGERLPRARFDILGMIDGWRPGSTDLLDAPILMDWAVQEAPAAILIGRMHGHLHIRSGHHGATSMLIALDKNWRWARTVSRFYRLGRPGREERR